MKSEHKAFLEGVPIEDFDSSRPAKAPEQSLSQREGG
jgi:hypothetical protein